MMGKQLLHIVLMMLVWLISSAPLLSAEWFVDLYGGAGFVQDNDVSIEQDLTGQGLSVSVIEAELKDLEIDDFALGGLRAGYWFDTARAIGLDVGLGIDAFVFQLDMSSQIVRSDSNVEINIGVGNEQFLIPAGNDQATQLPSIDGDPTAVLSFELMLRLPLLTTPQFPHGHLQPQLTVAPALMFTDTDFSVTPGVKVGAGLTWQFHQHFALFVEYRFTHFQFEVSDTALLVEGVVIADPDVEIDLNTHHVLAGVSIRL